MTESDVTPEAKRAALIGTGMVAATHVRAIEATGGRVRLEALCSRDARRAATFAERVGLGDGVRVHDDVAAVAADPDIDFAIVVTPPNARGEIVETLATAGKPILMEKPIERTLAAATALVERCERAGVPLGIVLQHRVRPAALELAGILARGELGELAAVEIVVPWWREQAYYDEPGRGTLARDGGGVLISQAIHTIDLALHLAGPAARVQAMTRTTALHRMEAEDFAVIGVDFANGAVGSIVASTASFPGGSEGIALHGTLGSARLDAARLEVRLRDGTVRTVGGAGGSGGGADPMAFTHDWHRAVIEDFARCLDGARAPVAPGRDALGVHRLIDAATRSSAEGRAVDLARDDHPAVAPAGASRTGASRAGTPPADASGASR